MSIILVFGPFCVSARTSAIQQRIGASVHPPYPRGRVRVCVRMCVRMRTDRAHGHPRRRPRLLLRAPGRVDDGPEGGADLLCVASRRVARCVVSHQNFVVSEHSQNTRDQAPAVTSEVLRRASVL